MATAAMVEAWAAVRRSFIGFIKIEVVCEVFLVTEMKLL